MNSHTLHLHLRSACMLSAPVGTLSAGAAARILLPNPPSNRPRYPRRPASRRLPQPRTPASPPPSRTVRLLGPWSRVDEEPALESMLGPRTQRED